MTHSSNTARLTTALALTLACALPCAPLMAQESVTPSVATVSAGAPGEMDALMAYVLKTRQLAPEQLALEARELRRLHDEGNDVATLKLALLLSDQAVVQENDVVALLQPLFEESRATRPELRAFALLISRDMQDRKRMKETLASTQSRLKDAQKNQEASEAKAAQMRRQIDELQNKINAFMMMEQSILKRGR